MRIGRLIIIVVTWLAFMQAISEVGAKTMERAKEIRALEEQRYEMIEEIANEAFGETELD